MLLFFNPFGAPPEISRAEMLRHTLPSPRYLGLTGLRYIIIILLSLNFGCYSNIADNCHKKIGIKFRN